MTCTKVSLNEANIRATPKTSSPVWGIVYESGLARFPHKDWIFGEELGPGYRYRYRYTDHLVPEDQARYSRWRRARPSS